MVLSPILLLTTVEFVYSEVQGTLDFSSLYEGTESADIATNESILLLDEYSKVKLF